MIARYNNISLAFGAPGIIVQIVGAVFRANGKEAVGIGISLAGTALLLVGLAYYAMAKGRNPAWCLMAFLSLIGLIVLACLSDLAPEGRSKRKKKRRRREDDDDEDEDRRRRRKRRADEDEDVEDDLDEDRPTQRRRRARDDEDFDEDRDEDRPRKRSPSRRDDEDQDVPAVRIAAEPAPVTCIATCPACQKKLKVPERLIGKNVKCPGCGKTFVA